jgi:hypothetical protein
VIEQFRRQHGAISRADGLAAGLTRRQIALRVKSGDWLEPKPGVYRHAAVPVTPELLIMEAVLSAGPNSVASHQSAAYLWGVLSWSDAGERAAVTVPAAFHPRAYGFDVHRTNDPDWGGVHLRSRIECRDPLRTLVDLAGVATPPILDSAVDRALSSGLVTVGGLQSEIGRRSVPGRNGVGVLRERLKDRGFIGGPSASALELRGVAFLRRFGLPLLDREVVTGSDGEHRIDFVLAHHVAWELDGYAWHFRPEHKSRDERRRNKLRAAGWEIYVSDWLSLSREPQLIAHTLRLAVSRRMSSVESFIS